MIHSIRDIRKDIDGATRWREIEADGSQDVNVNHEIFADAINYASKRERERQKERWVHRDGLGERAATHKRAAEHLK